MRYSIKVEYLFCAIMRRSQATLC